MGETEWENGLTQDNVVEIVDLGNLAGILAQGPETPEAPFLPLHTAVFILIDGIDYKASTWAGKAANVGLEVCGIETGKVQG